MSDFCCLAVTDLIAVCWCLILGVVCWCLVFVAGCWRLIVLSVCWWVLFVIVVVYLRLLNVEDRWCLIVGVFCNMKV